MMKRVILLAVILTIGCAAFLAPNAFAGDIYDISLYIPMTTWSAWVYHNEDGSIDGATYHNRYVFIPPFSTFGYSYTHPGSVEEYFAYGTSQLFMYGYRDSQGQTYYFDAPLSIAPRLVEVGKSYNSSTTFTYSGYSALVTHTQEVLAVEDVNTAGGVFFKNCLKMKSTTVLRVPALGIEQTIQTIDWYYQDFGRVVSYDCITHKMIYCGGATVYYQDTGYKKIYFSSSSSDPEATAYTEFYNTVNSLAKKIQKKNGTYITYEYWSGTSVVKKECWFNRDGVLQSTELFDASGHSISLTIQKGATITRDSIVTDSLVIGGPTMTTTDPPKITGEPVYTYYPSGNEESCTYPDGSGYVRYDENFYGNHTGRFYKQISADGSYVVYDSYYKQTNLEQPLVVSYYSNTKILIKQIQYYVTGNVLMIIIPGVSATEYYENGQKKSYQILSPVDAFTPYFYQYNWGEFGNNPWNVRYSNGYSMTLSYYVWIKGAAFPCDRSMTKLGTGQLWAKVYDASLGVINRIDLFSGCVIRMAPLSATVIRNVAVGAKLIEDASLAGTEDYEIYEYWSGTTIYKSSILFNKNDAPQYIKTYDALGRCLRLDRANKSYETYEYWGNTATMKKKEIYSQSGLIQFRETFDASGRSVSVQVFNGYHYTAPSIVTDSLIIGGSSTVTTQSIVADSLTIGASTGAAPSSAAVSAEQKSRMDMMAQKARERLMAIRNAGLLHSSKTLDARRAN